MGRWPRNRPHLPILLYHAVDDSVSRASPFSPYAISRGRFVAHLDHLVANGYQTLTVTELVERLATGQAIESRTVVITFDDGFADFAHAAWPELQARGLAATLYVTTGDVGGTSRWLAGHGEGDRPMCSWDQLRELADSGCEIGAHSVTHPSLDCVPPAVARDEMEASKHELEQQLQRSVRSFAYPHGHHDKTVRALAQNAGFDSACAVGNWLSHVDDDVLALGRFTVTSKVDVDQLDAVLTAKRLRLAPRRELLRTRTYRAVRRAKWRAKSSAS